MAEFAYAIVRTDGSHEFVECEHPLDDADLTALVGGLFEIVMLNEQSAYISEGGKIFGQPVNTVATELAHRHQGIHAWDTINGDMVILGPADEEGRDLPLSRTWYDTHLAGSFR